MTGKSVICLLPGLLAPVLLAGQSRIAEPVDLPLSHPTGRLSAPHLVFPIREPIHTSPPVTNPGLAALPQLVRSAGRIFTGTVTRIERRPGVPGQTIETVAVTFHVEKAIKGTAAGEDLTIAQWTGLWSSGQRYQQGKRVLLFLYPNSKLGLTSCVGGQLGRFDVDSAGTVLLTAQHLAAFRTDSVVGGKSRLSIGDFALAVQRASEEE